MPPKRPSRKTTSAQSTSSSRRRRNELGADDDGCGANDVSMMDGDEIDRLNDGDGESGTESASDLRDLEQSLKMSMVVDTGLRKEQRQRHLETEFENQVRAVEERIEDRCEGRKREVDHIQDDFLTRLLTLSRRKSELETQIIRETQDLADAYLGLKGEFEAVLQGRQEDVNEAISSLNQLEEAAPPMT